MKYLIVGAIVFIVIMGVFTWAVCVGASKADERYEELLREQWLRHQR